ncbi:MAG: T9SS type A sorting domain-containing protein [Flavobacteriaceae bacterium]
MPNPSKDFFTINYPLDVSTQIFDFRGVLIKKTKDKIIDITNLESGIYLVMITNSSGQINYQKLIKK